MESLPKEILSEVLACLCASEIVSLVSCCRSLYDLVRSMDCLTTSTTFRKATSLRAWNSTYMRHFMFQHVAGSTGAVTFRFSPLRYTSCLSRKMILQALTLVNEWDAVRWFCRASNTKVPKRHSPTVFLYRSLEWDFVLYSVLSNALQESRLDALYLHIKSIPQLLEDTKAFPSSSQAFFCNLLSHAHSKTLHLHMVGTPHDAPHVPISRLVMDEDRRNVDRVFEETVWGENITMEGLHDLRSSTIGLGMALATVDPRLQTLDVSHYKFDEVGPSLDAASFSSWFRWSKHNFLTKVNLHGISFSSGVDCCNVLHSLCRVPTLQSLRLSVIEYWTDAPMDVLLLVFEESRHIHNLRLHNVMRSQVDAFPFHMLMGARHRSLSMSRMFLDTISIIPLTLVLPMLPHLVSLDLSSNGLDGACLELFTRVLKTSGCMLQRLNLSSNIITNHSVSVFCDALRINKSLLRLDLGDNFLGTQSGTLIVKTVLMYNDTLRYLNLDCNQIRLTMEDLYGILLLVVKPNKSVFRQMSLQANPLDIPDKQRAEKYRSFFLSTFGVSFQF
jgi:Leucine-rich repeat (LRR) protein